MFWIKVRAPQYSAKLVPLVYVVLMRLKQGGLRQDSVVYHKNHKTVR